MDFLDGSDYRVEFIKAGIVNHVFCTTLEDAKRRALVERRKRRLIPSVTVTDWDGVEVLTLA